MEYKTEFGPGDEVYYVNEHGVIASSTVIEVSVTDREGSVSLSYKVDSLGKEIYLFCYRVYASPEALCEGILERYRKK